MIYSDFYRLDIPAFLLFFFGGLIYRREALGRIGEGKPAFSSSLPDAPPDVLSPPLHARPGRALRSFADLAKANPR